MMLENREKEVCMTKDFKKSIFLLLISLCLCINDDIIKDGPSFAPCSALLSKNWQSSP